MVVSAHDPENQAQRKTYLTADEIFVSSGPVAVWADRRRRPCAFGNGREDGSCRRSGVTEFEDLFLCEHHFEETGVREHRDRWEEIDLCLEMWLTAAQGWENETLL